MKDRIHPDAPYLFPFRGPDIGTHLTITYDHELLSLHGQRRFHPADPRHPDRLVDRHEQHTVEDAEDTCGINLSSPCPPKTITNRDGLNPLCLPPAERA